MESMSTVEMPVQHDYGSMAVVAICMYPNRDSTLCGGSVPQQKQMGRQSGSIVFQLGRSMPYMEEVYQ